MTFSQLVVWAVVGLIAGSLTARIVTGSKTGFGWYRNAALGLSGAVVGGLVVRGLGLLQSLDAYAISLRDVVSAVAGSALILFTWWLYQRRQAKPE